MSRLGPSLGRGTKGERVVLVTRNILDQGLKHFNELIHINLLGNFVVKSSLKLQLIGCVACV